MIAVPKRPRPHQPEPPKKLHEASLKQQLINQVARGEQRAASELRTLISQEQESRVDDSATSTEILGSSYMVQTKDDQVLESLPMTATAGAREYFNLLARKKKGGEKKTTP